MFLIPPHAYKLLGDLAKALVKINGFTRGGAGGATWCLMRFVELVGADEVS